MAEKSKKQILSSVLKWAQIILNGGEQPATDDPQLKKATIADLNLDDLRREKIAYEQEEKKCLASVKEKEKLKRTLFDDAVQTSSEREQRVIARKIKEIDDEADLTDRDLKYYSKQIRFINGLIYFKKRSLVSNHSGTESILTKIGLEDLTKILSEASLDADTYEDKLNEALGIITEAKGYRLEDRVDQDEIEIMRAIQQAREAAEKNPSSLDQQYESMNRTLDERKKASSEKEEDF
jgi:hypothetical protein